MSEPSEKALVGDRKMEGDRRDHLRVRFLGSLDHLLARYDRVGRADRFNATTPADFDAWKLRVRRTLGDLLGLSRMEVCDPSVRETEEGVIDGVRRTRLLIQTEPDVWMPVYVLRPQETRAEASGTARLPCLIAAHGHNSGGKLAVAGIRDNPSVRASIEKANYDYGLAFARRGYLVFCPDARGFGERREIHRQGMEVRNAGESDAELMASSCSVLSRLGAGLGQTVAGMYAWDLMRLVDHMTRRPDCDPSRIGCIGLSGGGLQTLWLAALDDRVACAVVSGNYFGFRGSLLEQIRCECSYVPRLLEHVDAGDIGALIAPRPLLVEVGTQDVLAGDRGAANTAEQVEITRGAYRLLGADDRLVFHLFAGPHMWNGEKTAAFLERWLARA